MVEQAVPHAHQTALANSSESLQLGQVLGALLRVHAAEADANGAGRDDDDAVAIGAEGVCCLDDEREVGEQRLMRLLVDDGRCSWEGVLDSWEQQCVLTGDKTVRGCTKLDHDAEGSVAFHVFRSCVS